MEQVYIKKYAYDLPFPNYPVRRQDGTLTFMFPYSDIPEGYNPKLRVASDPSIWIAARKILIKNNFPADFSNTGFKADGISPVWGFHLNTWFKYMQTCFVENTISSLFSQRGDGWTLFEIDPKYKWDYELSESGNRILSYFRRNIKTGNKL